MAESVFGGQTNLQGAMSIEEFRKQIAQPQNGSLFKFNWQTQGSYGLNFRVGDTIYQINPYKIFTPQEIRDQGLTNSGAMERAAVAKVLEKFGVPANKVDEYYNQIPTVASDALRFESVNYQPVNTDQFVQQTGIKPPMIQPVANPNIAPLPVDSLAAGKTPEEVARLSVDTTPKTVAVPGQSVPTPQVAPQSSVQIAAQQSQLGEKIPSPDYLSNYREDQIIRTPDGIYLKPGIALTPPKASAPSAVQQSSSNLGIKIPSPDYLVNYTENDLVRQSDGSIYLKAGIPLKEPTVAQKLGTSAFSSPTSTIAPKVGDSKKFYRVGKDIFESGTGRYIGATEWNAEWSGKATEIPAPEGAKPAEARPDAKDTPKEGSKAVNVFTDPANQKDPIIDGILTGVAPEVKNVIKQITDQFAGTIEAVQKGEKINQEALDKAFAEIKEKNIDPYYKNLITNYQKDLYNNIGVLDAQRQLQLDQESQLYTEQLRVARQSLESTGLTFSGEATRQLGKESTFGTTAGAKTIAPAPIIGEGEIPRNYRQLSTSSRASYADRLRSMVTTGERYLGTENLPLSAVAKTNLPGQPSSLDYISGGQTGTLPQQQSAEEISTRQSLLEKQRATNNVNALSTPL